MEDARGIFTRVEEICILHSFQICILHSSKEFPGDCLERQQSATRVACELV